MSAAEARSNPREQVYEACRIIASVLDEEAVMSLALDAVVRLTGAVGAFVAAPGGESGSLAVVRTTSEHVRLQQALCEADLKALRVAEAWNNQRPTTMLVADLRALERRRLFASHRIASVVSVPVTGRHGPIQVICALHPEVEPGEETIAALRILGRHAGVALENARRYAAVEEQRARARLRLEALAQASRALSATPELSSILPVIMDQCRLLCPCEAGTLVMVDRVTKAPRVAQTFPRERHQEAVRRGVSPLVTWGIETGLPLLISADSQRKDVEKQVTTPVEGEVRDALCVPLVFGEQVLGAIELVNKDADGGFDNEDREGVANFASHAAVIIKNALLLEEVSELAIRDALTGLYNRRRFEEALVQSLAQHRRYESEVTVILMDVDKFKTINDTRGHAAGDAVLKVVADICVGTTRDTDTVARL
ncbi:MAG: diguanylate cyclase, partial [Armatimonadota bacterium]